MNAPAGSRLGNRSQRGRLGSLAGALRRAKGTTAPSGRRPRLLFAVAAVVAGALVLGVSLAAGAAPTVTVENASNVEYSTATVKGTVDPGGNETTYRFQFVTQTQFEAEGFAGAATELEGTVEGSGAKSVGGELTGLSPGTNYHLRLLAENAESAGTPSEAVAAATFTTKTVAKPTVSIEAVTTFTGTTATFSGHVNPNAPKAAGSQSPAEQAAFESHWEFRCEPDCPGLEGTVAADKTAHLVEAHATGLLPGTPYEVLLAAANAGGSEETGKVAFATPAIAPAIESTTVSGVDTSEATLNASVRPNGAATTVHFDYLSEAQYLADGGTFGAGTEKTPESAPIGSDDEVHAVSASLSGLGSATSYRYRVVATNEKSPESGTLGPASSFATSSTAPASQGCLNEQLRAENASLSLPDCRAYEVVSDLATSEEVYAPGGNEPRESLPPAFRPLVASADGRAVTFLGDPPPEAGGTPFKANGFGDEYLATRTGSGWQAADIQPPSTVSNENFPSKYQAFLPNLSLAFLVHRLNGQAAELAFNQAAEPPGPALPGCEVLYARGSDGSLHALFTETDGTGESPCGHPLYVGASEDGSQIFFQDEAPLLQGNTEVSGFSASFSDGWCARFCNLFDSRGGTLTTVNVLPDGSSEPPAVLGASGDSEGEENAGSPPAVNGAISGDGSRVYWTDLETGVIYLRENPGRQPSALDSEGHCTEPSAACTLQVSAGTARYWAASADGRYAYYTEAGSLWRFDSASGAREELDGPAAGVQGVIGVNREGSDGGYVYFVATGALSSTAESRTCEPAPEGTLEREEEFSGYMPAGRGCNLYLLHGGQPTLIAVLSARDDNELAVTRFGESGGSGGEYKAGDWQPSLSVRTAQISPDGQTLVFESGQDLTAYPPAPSPNNYRSRAQVYIYNSAGAGGLSCVSCSPTGVATPEGALLPVHPSAFTAQPRWMSGDGHRVFFDSLDPLVSTDGNGKSDVYEWEAQSSGSCAVGSRFNGDGCVYLLSGGTSPGASYFIDASASGSDAFIVTESQLTPTDRNELANVYSLSEGGGFPVPQISACEGEACRGPGSTGAGLQSAGTSTFTGPGSPTRVRPHKSHKKRRRHRRHHGHRGHRHHSHSRQVNQRRHNGGRG